MSATPSVAQPVASGQAATIRILTKLYYAVLLIGGLTWALDLPSRSGFSLIEPEFLGPYLGVATAAAFLEKPYGRMAGLLEILLGASAIACWLWLAINYGAWLFDVEGYTAEKILPGVLALVLMNEAVRKSCGTAISVLVIVMIVYGLAGYMLPQPFQADRVSAELFVMYLYSDTNAVPGAVLGIIASVVLAFLIFGKLMEVSGATRFFTEIAMALMGHRRGGPAKIAITASALMGTISGSPVSNIMTAGVVTIPLMKRTGFSAPNAGAIEAVASTGGQITPPVMGATAFLMAEFLQLDYSEIALAAALPAILFYVGIFLQVDAVADRYGLAGLPRPELPRLWRVLRGGWLFILPLTALVYFLFFAGYAAQFAAIAASVVLLGFALLRRQLLSAREWGELIFEGGANLVPLVLIGGAAGVVVGIMNISGLGQSLSFILVQIGANWGLFATLVLTAVLSIALGMGMPTAAIYVVLASIVAPALITMGMSPIGAHLFIFYFGVLSFLTPPVAVASFVAAGLAQADMWRTSWLSMRYSVVAFVLPFIWAYDSALLLDGSVLAVVIVLCTTIVTLMLIARSIQMLRDWNLLTIGLGTFLVLLMLAVATSPVWLGSESLLALVVAAIGLGAYYALPLTSPPCPAARDTAPDRSAQRTQDP